MMHKMIAALALTGLLAFAGLAAPPAYGAGDPGLTGYNYAIATKVMNKPQVYWTHIAVNRTALPDDVEFAVTRTKSFTGSVLISAEANVLTYKCQVAAEVTFGSSVSIYTKCRYAIPAYSSVTCLYGSSMVRTTGSMEYWQNGRILSSRAVSDNYSYGGYSDKYYN